MLRALALAACAALACAAVEPPAAVNPQAPAALEPPAAPASPVAPAVPASAGEDATAAIASMKSVAVIAEDGPGTFPFFAEQRTAQSMAAAVAGAVRGALLPMQVVRVVDDPAAADWIIRIRVIDAGAGQQEVEVRASGYRGQRVGAQIKGGWTLLARSRAEFVAQGNFETGTAGDAAGPAGAQIGTAGRAADFLATEVGRGLSGRIADEVAPPAVQRVQGSTVTLNAGRTRGVALGSAWAVFSPAGAELAVVEVTGLNDTTAIARIASGEVTHVTPGCLIRPIPAG